MSQGTVPTASRPAPPRRAGARDGSSWRVPLALVVLSLVPVVAGTIRLVEVAGGPALMPANPRIDASPAPVPRTVEELAGQTVKSSKEGIEKAGEAIGGTAKKAGEHISNAGSAIGSAASKTWSCITSLFSSCGEEQEPPAAPDEPPVN